MKAEIKSTVEYAVITLLVAGIFKLTGVYTPLSAWLILATNCVFNALAALAVWEIGRRMFSRANAVWAAWIWARGPRRFW